MTLKLWPKGDSVSPSNEPVSDERRTSPKPKNFFRNSIAGCVFYFLYPGLEITTGLWGASLLINTMNMPIKTAGLTISLFWGSLTAGRLITGAFFSGFADRAIIRGGLAIAGAGILVLIFTKNPTVATVAFAVMGLGFAPVYPSMMHDTPRRVGKAFAERIISLQVGSAFTGVSILPALTGYVAARSSLAVIAPIMLCFAAATAFVHEISTAGAAEAAKNSVTEHSSCK